MNMSLKNIFLDKLPKNIEVNIDRRDGTNGI